MRAGVATALAGIATISASIVKLHNAGIDVLGMVMLALAVALIVKAKVGSQSE